MFNFFKRKNAPCVPFDEQLRVLADCGISLSQNVRPESLLESFSREEFEKQPFQLLLCAMGGEAEVESQAGPNGYPSDSIWHFDTECIEDHGSYAAIARRLAVLAHPALPIEDVEDYVDIEGDEAWISFKLDGQPEKWVAEVNDDWVDATVLSRFAVLLQSRSLKRFTYVDLGGQDCLIGCATPDQKEKLTKATKLKVKWLT
jgi:hypothetical protein